MAGRGGNGWDGGFPPASHPREARGGIRAQSQRGAMGRTWWARRWIQALERMGLGARLTRGRSYARRGQVLSVEVDGGIIQARVQGSRAKPYTVRIAVRPLPEASWAAVGRALAAQAAYAARLLAGEMPQDVEEVFAAAGVSLFPASMAEMETACSCPDWSNPCKHIAAVYYLVGEEFDRDPFLLFQLRGLSRQGLAELLAGSVAGEEVGLAEAEPLPGDPQAFWAGGPGVELPLENLEPPPVSAALLRRLGNLPFWRGGQSLADGLAGAYAAATARGLRLLTGETPEGAVPGAAPADQDPPRRPTDGGSVPEAGPRSIRGHPPAKVRSEAPGEPGPGATGPDGAGAAARGAGGLGRAPAPGGKSRDRAALERELRAGSPLEGLRAKYDGRVLRAALRRADGAAAGPGRDG